MSYKCGPKPEIRNLSLACPLASSSCELPPSRVPCTSRDMGQSSFPKGDRGKEEKSYLGENNLSAEKMTDKCIVPPLRKAITKLKMKSYL